jgi:hypothetical protein
MIECEFWYWESYVSDLNVGRDISFTCEPIVL